MKKIIFLLWYSTLYVNRQEHFKLIIFKKLLRCIFSFSKHPDLRKPLSYFFQLLDYYSMGCHWQYGLCQLVEDLGPNCVFPPFTMETDLNFYYWQNPGCDTIVHTFSKSPVCSFMLYALKCSE